jgi:hypothetical protein
MKGIVFTEFLEMVEEKFSPEMADRMIIESGLESGGAYTAVGTYSHEEMLAMVTRLSDMTSVPVTDLVTAFGEYLLVRFTRLYPNFFEGIENTFDFLESIENHVHVEVRKLYPDAELPNFTVERPDSETLIMTYHSKRPFAPLALGLINGTARYFEEDIHVEMSDLSDGKGSHARFILTKQQA